jgi:hypothetical protein
MIEHLMVKQKMMKSSTLMWLMFCSYYFFVGALCLLVIVAEQAVANSDFARDGFVVAFLCCGALVGFFLWCISTGSRFFFMDVFLKKYRWVEAFKNLIDFLFCISVMFAPAFFIKFNPEKRDDLQFIVLSLLALFLLLWIISFLCRAVRVRMGLNHDQ